MKSKNPVTRSKRSQTRAGSSTVKDSSILQHQASISPNDLKALLSLRHHDPHQILGPHPSDDGIVVRAFFPDAKTVEVESGTKQPQAMVKVSEVGLFELFLPCTSKLPSYRLIVQSRSGEVKTIHDPYSFLPTVGELDLHLFGEGKHEEIYQKLGAHITMVNRVSGVAFAVWAPQAHGVSVVGDFNSWDGRPHQIRMLGGSGAWALFIPGLSAGGRSTNFLSCCK